MSAAPAKFVAYNCALEVGLPRRGIVPGRTGPWKKDTIAFCGNVAIPCRIFVVCHSRFPPAFSGFVE
jgi:hypothetical protein